MLRVLSAICLLANSGCINGLARVEPASESISTVHFAQPPQWVYSEPKEVTPSCDKVYVGRDVSIPLKKRTIIARLAKERMRDAIESLQERNSRKLITILAAKVNMPFGNNLSKSDVAKILEGGHKVFNQIFSRQVLSAFQANVGKCPFHVNIQRASIARGVYEVRASSFVTAKIRTPYDPNDEGTLTFTFSHVETGEMRVRSIIDHLASQDMDGM